MCKTSNKMHMYDMGKIDTIVFEIMRGAFKVKGQQRGMFWDIKVNYRKMQALL